MSSTEREALKSRLYRALNASHAIFGDAAFRKPKRKSRSPINKALFEVWTVTLDKQSDESLSHLEASADKVKSQVDSFMRNDSEFMDAVSQGTGDTTKVQLRFERFRQVIEEADR